VTQFSILGQRAHRLAARLLPVATLLLVLVTPAVAQEVAPQACADAKEQIRYLVNEGAFIQDASLKNGVNLLGNAIMLRNAACGTPGDESIPLSSETPPTPAPAPTPVMAVPTPVPVADDKSSFPSPAACLLATEKEVGAAMKQAVTASADDPLGDPTPGVQGCDYNGAGAAFATIMYFQDNAAFVYDSFHSTAESNGVESVPGLGDRAFIYVGGDGPGVVVAKGDKLFTLEFSGVGSGPAEKSSLLALAQQAVNRIQLN
jgi:hypothetical protein